MKKPEIVLFDLDGTLLPMDQEAFTKGYFGLLAKKAAPFGYEPEKLVEAVWTGTKAMVKNDGKVTNEEKFWQTFGEIYGREALKDIPIFDEFYEKEFDGAKAFCGYTPKADETVKKAKDLGLRVALATNPLFPRTATEKRIRWAGLSPEEFELFTTYENAAFCKPNPSYYIEVAEKLGVFPERCLMVGNDAVEDLAAEQAGMGVFLLTDCLINKTGADLSAVPRGGFDDLLRFLEGLC